MEILAKKVGKWHRIRMTETCNGNFKVWGSAKRFFGTNKDRAKRYYEKMAAKIREE